MRKAVETTDYPNQDDLIRDRRVMGSRDGSSKEKLMRKSGVTLMKANNDCRATQIS